MSQTMDVSELDSKFSGRTISARTMLEMMTDKRVIEIIFDKMYNHPVIVVCVYCNACNAITNAICVQCGAPLGEAQRKAL